MLGKRTTTADCFDTGSSEGLSEADEFVLNHLPIDDIVAMLHRAKEIEAELGAEEKSEQPLNLAPKTPVSETKTAPAEAGP